jgi:large subunit ribosomal protein L29
MKTFEIRELSDAELQKRIQEEKDALAHLNFQKATKQIENTAQIRIIRRTIARMNTMLNERQRKAASTQA